MKKFQYVRAERIEWGQFHSGEKFKSDNGLDNILPTHNREMSYSLT